MKWSFSAFAFLIVVSLLSHCSSTEGPVVKTTDVQTLSFGERGQFKMLNDVRQRPQSVYMDDKIHIVYNAGAENGATGPADTKPMIVTYDVATGKFSDAVTLGPGTDDHHHGPVVWADTNKQLHVLFGCHGNAGTHLISKKPGIIGTTSDDWDIAPQIAPGISYPKVYGISGSRQLVYYRTGGHTSSWTYRISGDNGRAWAGPEKDVTDFDMNSKIAWCSYHSAVPSSDGRYLHVAFVAFDDNRPTYNPRYNTEVSPSHCKYNLYYVKIDLQTHDVFNFLGEKMSTPIDFYQANEKCRIWDTDWRVTGVPPDIQLDGNGNPVFLHVLSAESLETYNYHFIRLVGNEWKETVVASANHQWCGGHIDVDDNDLYHAYIVTGDTYFVSDGFNERHGGGRVEEWISSDKGNTWEKLQDITPDPARYPEWKFNNIQPVTKPDGSIAGNSILFYGWKDKNAPDAKGFLRIMKPGQ